MSFGGAMENLALASDRIDPPGPGHNNMLGLDIARQVQLAKERGPPLTFSANLPPPFVNSMGFIALHKATVANDAKTNERKKESGNVQVSSKQTMRPHIVHGPAPPILSLKKTTLREVAKKVNYIHEDRIMFVQTIYASHRIVGTNVLVQDDIGDCLMLSLYNFVPTSENPNDFFPEGTHMALLAPYMKNSADDPTKNLLLRCDNPECIRVFDSRRSWLAAKQGKKLIDTEGLDPSQLRLDGNNAFANSRYEAAARFYTRALQCQNIQKDDKLACHSNLAETKIRQEQWEAAEENAKSALELDKRHVKALFRLATAQIHLGKIVEAMAIITEERKETYFQKLREHVNQLIREQEGCYDFPKMRKEARARPGQTLSRFHANFTSPQIQQRVQISKRDGFTYRGTLATEELRGGTLVSSSKALVFSASKDTALDYNINPYSKSILKGSTMEVESELISLMHRRPSTRKTIYSLASCSTSESEDFKRNKGNIDSLRVQHIVASNTFAVAREEEVLSAWKNYREFQNGKSSAEREGEERANIFHSGSGIWVNESLFNHSCTPNCTWKQIGDQMFVWTTRDVEAREELTLAYISHDASFLEREEAFKRWIQPGVGFTCQCDWCHHMRLSDELRKIENQIHSAHRKAAEMVSKDGFKMALAAERAMPSTQRKSYLKILSELPLQLQHNSSARLWVMEGSCLSHFDSDAKGALTAYEKAADINYAVRGGCSLERAKNLWRIVGAAMACENPSKAQTVLMSIYQDIFLPLNMKTIEEAFRDLTLNYALPWWQDSYDRDRQRTLEILVDRVIKDSAGRSTQRKYKKNKRK